jgi:hypothetical protein
MVQFHIKPVLEGKQRTRGLRALMVDQGSGKLPEEGPRSPESGSHYPMEGVGCLAQVA